MENFPLSHGLASFVWEGQDMSNYFAGCCNNNNVYMLCFMYACNVYFPLFCLDIDGGSSPANLFKVNFGYSYSHATLQKQPN